MKEYLLSNDPKRIEYGIFVMISIYPYELFRRSGKLKARNRLKRDSDFIKTAIGWSDMIHNVFKNIKDAEKCVGKTPKQIQGYKKMSIAGSMRWGSSF
jgi:hypothetical protein